MKTFALIFVHFACAFVLLFAACHKSNAGNSKIQGNWHSKDGTTRLKITDKQFTLDNDSPVPEDYFIKGDTIFTSFEGNQPYTRFVIQRADDKQLDLLFPDSVTVSFTR